MKRIHEVPSLARLKRDAHKRDRGRVLVVAGSVRMSGAARLAGWGALRGGAGLVTVATPAEVQPLVAADLPCAMTVPLQSRKGVLGAAAAVAAREAAENADAIVIGPGLTTGVAAFLRRFLKGLSQPIVLDADALTLLAEHEELRNAGGEARVLTPHPGEAARILHREIPRAKVGRLEAATDIAEMCGAVCVLKGAGTIVCDGDRWYHNRTGNPGMATGGTGDVLAGLIGALLARGGDPLTAAVQGVWIHGRAGDLASAAIGENSMIATDLVANLPAALAEVVESNPRGRKPADKKTESDGKRSRGSGRAR
ncbi:MAG: NAD(P)H-hydrate dehydratase [Planctomycetota bacterium]